MAHSIAAAAPVSRTGRGCSDLSGGRCSHIPSDADIEAAFPLRTFVEPPVDGAPPGRIIKRAPVALPSPCSTCSAGLGC
eukprot:scaffold67628_cov73-Phaeocystis_antarctica.AAC.7